MLSFVANSLLTPLVARKLARVIPNPLVRTLAVAAVGYGINYLATRPSTRRLTNASAGERAALPAGALSA